MKSFFKCVLSAALLSVTANQASAADIYECKFKQNAANGNWIPEIVFVVFDQKTGEVLVSDPIIHHFVKKPIEGKLAANNSARITVSWALKGTTNSSNQWANMSYRMTYLKKQKTASISGQAHGYVGPYTAQGSCILGKTKR